MKFTIDLADFFIFFAEKAYKHNAHNRKADHQKAHEICIINSDVKMSKRIHKLSFFIGLNVNGKKSVIKVKQEDSSEFFIFDEDHQSPDLHPLICKRVDKVKLTAKRTYEIIEHFCTDSEAGQYLPGLPASKEFVFKAEERKSAAVSELILHRLFSKVRSRN